MECAMLPFSKQKIHNRVYTTTMHSPKFQDDIDLEARGYQRAMPRQFSTFSLVALSFSLTCTWSGTGSSIGISLQEASAAGTIWSLPVAALMTAILSAGVAELASAYPVAGAQYYWTFCLASKDWRAFASYMFVLPIPIRWLMLTYCAGMAG